MRKAKNFSGQKGNGIEILEPTEMRSKEKQIIWKCRCFCGKIFFASASEVKRNRVASCGCLKGIEKAHQTMRKNLKEGTNLLLLQARKRKNNTSGHKGISWDKQRKKWVVQIRLQGKNHKIGRFLNLKEAIEARKQAEKKYFEPILKQYNKNS